MRWRLYIAGDSPSARAAQRSLQALPALGASCEIIDVLTRPGEAATAGLPATPTLVVEGGGRRHNFVADFSAAPARMKRSATSPPEGDPESKPGPGVSAR